LDDSTEGMQRLRNPFAVEPAATRTATTSDEPSAEGHQHPAR
jgi:hypothetical protein